MYVPHNFMIDSGLTPATGQRRKIVMAKTEEQQALELQKQLEARQNASGLFAGLVIGDPNKIDTESGAVARAYYHNNITSADRVSLDSLKIVYG